MHNFYADMLIFDRSIMSLWIAVMSFRNFENGIKMTKNLKIFYNTRRFEPLSIFNLILALTHTRTRTRTHKHTHTRTHTHTHTHTQYLKFFSILKWSTTKHNPTIVTIHSAGLGIVVSQLNILSTLGMELMSQYCKDNHTLYTSACAIYHYCI